MKSSFFYYFSLFTVTLLNGPLMAQEADAESRDYLHNELEEVLVTATRREVRLQDVPLSITAFTQEDLNEKGIVSYQGLAYNTPGVVLNRASANFNNFSVRGIATNGYNANLQSTVAIYIDELPISSNGNSTILDPNLFDVERVEFLRGPQGTLFGSNSLAGAVRLINKDPVMNEFQTSGLIDYGVTDSDAFRQRYNFMLNMPIADDSLAVRVVGFYRDEEGYIDNIGTGIDNANTLVDYGGRIIAKWDATDKLYFRAMYMTEDSKPQDASLVAPQRGDKIRLTDRPDEFQGFIDIFNLTVGYDFDWADLTSSTTWSNYDGVFFVDLAGTFGQAIAFALDAVGYDENFVEEIRLVSDTDGPLEWVVGGYYNYKRRDVDYNYRSNEAFLAARGITGLPNPPFYQQFQSYFVTHETAGFGELTYHVNDDFWLTGGLRYTESDVQGFTKAGGYNSNYLVMALFGLSGPVTLTPVAAATGVKGEESGFSYKASASWRPVENITTYATVSTGFRTPVVNARAGQGSVLDPNDIIIPFGADSDSLINYEIGVKGTFFDNRVSAHIAAYYIDWSDIQVQANRVSDTVQFATNIGGATSKGLEIEASWAATSNLLLGLNASFNNAEVDDLTESEAAISGATLGSDMAFPPVQGSAYLRYNFDLGGEMAGFFTVNALYVDGFPNQFPFAPGRPGVPVATYDESESYSVVNLTLGSTFKENFTVTGYVENLFDDDSFNYVHPEAFIEARYGIPIPRTWGIRLSYEY
ncbi:MAG TPA: TonB-dependent receptor [Xanthomonadales bacterium]|nr:TonB-dependent receptor [Xanthomonadales bacterium]